jgi:hypothetical protein
VAADAGVSQTTAAVTLPLSVETLPPPHVYVNLSDTPRTPFDEVAAAQTTISASGSDGEFMGSSKSARMFLPQGPTASGSGSSAIMYSSKDGIVFPPNSATAPAPAATVLSARVIAPQKTAQTQARPATVMPGSKSAAVISPSPNSPAIPAKTGSEATMMSSSKSIILTPPPRQATAPGQVRGKFQSAQRARQPRIEETRP